MDVSQYLEIFIEEAKEHLQSLNENLLVLEKEPENKDTINEIFRSAHSLKGMAGTMGYKRMQHLTHDMENVFQEVRSDKMKVSSELVDGLFRGLDALQEYLDNIINTQDEGTNDNQVLEFVSASNEVLVVATPEPTSITDAYALLKTLNRKSDFVKENTSIRMVANRIKMRIRAATCWTV